MNLKSLSTATLAVLLTLSGSALSGQNETGAPSSEGARFRSLLGTYQQRFTARDDSDDTSDLDDTDDRYVALVRPHDDLNGPEEAASDIVKRTGFLSIKKNERGYFTARLKYGSKNIPFKGRFRFGSYGKWFGRGDRAILLTLRIEPDKRTLFGEVSDVNDEIISVLEGGGQNRFRRAKNEHSGKYTVVFPGDDSNDIITPFPNGDGFAKVKISRRGDARLVGKLADGTKLSAGTLLTVNRHLPFFTSLYKKKGMAAGFAKFFRGEDDSDEPDDSDDSADGYVRHIKPAAVAGTKRYKDGFAIYAPFAGSRYKAPKRGKRVIAELNATQGETSFLFGEGNLEEDIVQSLTISKKNKVKVPRGSLIKKVKINVNNGVFSGKFQPEGVSKPLKFNGVIFQSQAKAAGFFLGATESGFVRLGADDSSDDSSD